ncbi:MAG TPA: HAMP domain-containing sensor histidine kinase, partial [Acetobacteraceae bacterium]|nr:HAMP domain-containing sensor histidine kinase [Acetobacteraceae bacterium]
ANMSHELRTPLNAVINFARLIEQEVHGPLGAPEYRDYARDIAESGSSQLELIDELLDLARAEVGRLTIAESVVDPARLIAATCRVLAPEAANAGVALDYVVAPGVGHLRGDPGRLRQVLLNLTSNAIKFTCRGGAVSVHARGGSDGTLQIAVRDTGVGIAEQDLHRVMEPFEQAAPASGRRPGVGLGLPLSRHLVELHGGDLRLESAPGRGTTAMITLPASRMLLPARRTAERADAAA